ncbi:MAG: hypothetical protein LBR29_10935 [Methylobacteriaceae bacterium]|jgi:hypothetical protein|nr:hypothetical protein [Methylobacteriaceae bacterium]
MTQEAPESPKEKESRPILESYDRTRLDRWSWSHAPRFDAPRYLNNLLIQAEFYGQRQEQLLSSILETQHQTLAALEEIRELLKAKKPK